MLDLIFFTVIIVRIREPYPKHHDQQGLGHQRAKSWNDVQSLIFTRREYVCTAMKLCPYFGV